MCLSLVGGDHLLAFGKQLDIEIRHLAHDLGGGGRRVRQHGVNERRKGFPEGLDLGNLQSDALGGGGRKMHAFVAVEQPMQ